MKKAGLIFLLLIDVLLIGASGAFLYFHVTTGYSPTTAMGGRMGVITPSIPKAIPAAPANPAVAVSPSTNSPVTPAATATPATAGATDAGVRKILFTYHNSKAKQVSIRADFTGWKADPMKKGENEIWEYQANLTPGEYAYCFTADDKTFRDPANKRTKQIGRTFVSAIEVRAIEPK